jgi:programmed cell death protein 5
MDNIAQVSFDPKDLPDGFTSADPNAGPEVGRSDDAKGKEEQKQAILQQALMPDALARLRRIKVRCP